jgi:hypothetical protein
MPSVASACGNSAHPLGTTGFQGYVRIADHTGLMTIRAFLGTYFRTGE